MLITTEISWEVHTLVSKRPSYVISETSVKMLSNHANAVQTSIALK
jgi:hypothetical protein